MVELTIDGKKIQAAEGTMILQAASDNRIYIPSLCDNESILPYGACRLCLVEITTARGRKRMVASCLYQVEEGLVVETSTERIARNRRMLMQLLLARCPNLKAVQDMARKLGVEDTPFRKDDDRCILCGLCVRACQEVVGVSAISLVNRGVDRQVATPFNLQSDACIGCGSCAFICPVDAISMEDSGDTRTLIMPNPDMENIQFKLRKCRVCGDYWAPEKQLEHIAKISGTSPGDYAVCPDCRD